MSARYERGSITVTTAKHVRDWPDVFAGDEILTTAILDRLLHHVHIVHIDGRSYRFRELDQPITAPPPAPPDDPTHGGLPTSAKKRGSYIWVIANRVKLGDPCHLWPRTHRAVLCSRGSLFALDPSPPAALVPRGWGWGRGLSRAALMEAACGVHKVAYEGLRVAVPHDLLRGLASSRACEGKQEVRFIREPAAVSVLLVRDHRRSWLGRGAPRRQGRSSS